MPTPSRTRFRAVIASLRRSEAYDDGQAQAEAASAALLSLVARLRPDLTVDDALVEVDLTLAEFSAALDGQAAPLTARPEKAARTRHLWAVPTAAALASGGLAVPRVVAWAAHAAAVGGMPV